MFSSVLVVCTGNICRSPMGEFLLRERWARSGGKVHSAGTHAMVNYPADEEAQALMLERGVDMAAHRARQINLELVQESDLILVMEKMHLDWIHGRFPPSRGRVHLMSKWIDLPEIDDPYRRGREAFERSLDELERSVDSWLQRIS